MTYLQKLKALDRQRANNRYAERICSELTYLDGISKNDGGAYDDIIEKAAEFLLERIKSDGVITSGAVKEAEEVLSPLSTVAKRYTELFISHAHIDMNWMWGYNETAAVTVDTFRTVLQLMREYPEMTFCQSQASTYEIIDRFCPELLPEIKQRIKEGRWEVTAAEWVEPDKNMPSGESLVRQILQSRKYLSSLLEIDPDSLDTNFVPDTFGHNANVPEILAQAGIKHMYHCRGHEGPCIYRYRSRSGASVLTYREYEWYNGEAEPHKFEIVPAFCRQEGVDVCLCVFGIGDHGGGPSRRDIEHIMEYQSWPYTPVIRFGTFREFFSYLEGCGKEFPVYDTERNYLFTGCYTTQTRIKMANRIAEARLYDAEALASVAGIAADAPLSPDRLDHAWRNVLFNHFHDILPGSGTIETREFAMGRFQEAMADINTYANLSMYSIAQKTDTSSIPFEESRETISEGGGVGHLQAQKTNFRFTSAERGNGPTRAIQIFNTTAKDRDEYTEITVWDYNDPFATVCITDPDGNELPFCVVTNGEGYWGHRYSTLLVKASVPAFGYTTVIIRQRETGLHKDPGLTVYEYTDTHINDDPFVLENGLLKAVFEKSTCRLISLTDKKDGKELISEPSCYFRYVEENPVYGATAWRVGPTVHTRDLNGECGVRYTSYVCNEIYGAISYELRFGSSLINCTVTLKKDSPVIEFKTRIDWSEEAVRGVRIPQLSFAVPVSYETTGTFTRDIPFGTLSVKGLAHDVPALSYVTADGSGTQGVTLMTDTKYGYRYTGKLMTVTLIRSSYDPDPYPDRGIHNVRIGVGVSDASTTAERFCKPMPFTSLTKHEGDLPLRYSALTVDGDVAVSAVKPSENGEGLTVRLFDTKGSDKSVTVSAAKEIKNAQITGNGEKPLCDVRPHNGKITVTVPAYGTVTLVIKF